MNRFRVELSEFTEEIQDFVDSFYNICYVVGGAKLVDQIADEMNYRLTDGEDFVRVVSDQYESFRLKYFN